MSSPEDEVMAEFRNAWNKVRGVLHAAWNKASGRNQPGPQVSGRIPDQRQTQELLRDSARFDAQVHGAVQELGGPETVRLTAAEARTFADMTGPGGDLNDLRHLNSFASLGQPGPGEAPRMAPGTATTAQTPVEAGHRTTQQQRGGPARPGVGI